jgi:hypothetical protein
MRGKTYMKADVQWDRTAALVLTARRPEVYHRELGGYGFHLGRIVQDHRLFLRGDVVLIHISNGMAERQPVWGVSSKGFAVRGFYLKYARYRDAKRFDGGPLRLVELPDHLTGKLPDDPDVRQFVVGSLRAGDAALG